MSKCLTRIEDALTKSGLNKEDAEGILRSIKKAESEAKLRDADDQVNAALAKEILDKEKIQKQINKLNAIEDEIKVREWVEWTLDNFKDNPTEGMTALLVGTNWQRMGARDSVAAAQDAYYKNLVVSFNAKLKEAGVDDLFAKMNNDIERKVSRVLWDLGDDLPIKEKDGDIVKLAKIYHEFSETVRKKYNNYGANIDKLPGWIVRQSSDPFQLRNALDVINTKNNVKSKDTNGTPEANLQAWKDYILPRLDRKRTFFETDDENIDDFLTEAYNSLIRNENQIVNSAGQTFGSKSLAKKIGAKRVLHFKSADDWYDYNSMFGGQNLKEAIFGGFHVAGKNIGMMSKLGSNPQNNYKKIGDLVKNELKGTDQAKAEKLGAFMKDQGGHKKFMAEVDGSVNTINGFAFAKWSAISRAIFAMAKLGGATISAISDIHLYAKEMKWQGRTYIGGLAEAMGRLAKIKNSKRKQEIAEQLGFINDNIIYDLAARYSAGDNLNRGFSQVQRTFFKLNGLAWWTNSLKDGAILGMGNYVAKQTKTAYKNLSPEFKRLINHYGINEKVWNHIRKMDLDKADDGKLFFNTQKIDDLPDSVIKDIEDKTRMSARQIEIARDNLKTRVLGMFLDRATYAVLEPDARTRGWMKLGQQAGTPLGEAIRFMGQFKAFPFAFGQKMIGRELAQFRAGTWKDGQKFRALLGMAQLVGGSALFGYIAMSAKDILKGKSTRDPINVNTFFAAMLQGGGLGIYTDFLFGNIKNSTSALATIAGPGPTEAVRVLSALNYAIRGEGGKAGKQAYYSIKENIPFLNLFYIKTVFDYLIGYQMMETLSPGSLRRMEKRMKESGQEFLFTKPSTLFKGF
jgi:hypothetical protein